MITNVRTIDETLKNANKSEFVVSLPIKQDDSSVFPSSFDFSHNGLKDYLPVRTSCISLSASRPKITLPIPEGVNAKKARISIQPLHGYGVSILFNGEPYSLPSRSAPVWEIMEFDITKTDKSISIEIDLENCSAMDAKLLLGNISLFD